MPSIAKPPIRTLLFSTLYPSSARPGHGLFVATRLRHLLAEGGVEARVVAPVPWFPSRHPRFGEWARMAATPRREVLDGVEVHHPRYPLPPRVGMTVAPLALALGARVTVARLIRDGFDFDLIDAHYYYPDGVAAALLGAWFGKPFIVTARGSDLNLLPQYALPRRMIRWAERRAAASIGVSRALVEVLAQLGGDPRRMHVLRNGVDLERFRPLERLEARSHLGLPPAGRLLLSVGNLVELKGHAIAIEALARLGDTHLAIVGQGPDESRLRRLAVECGVADRVRFAGYQPQSQLPWWYSAADALVLCSSREGWANVLLEALACGTPVVATPLPGNREVIQSRTAGVLMAQRSAPALCDAVAALEADRPSREAVRRYAEAFGWEETSRGQLDLFRECLARAGRGPAPAPIPARARADQAAMPRPSPPTPREH